MKKQGFKGTMRWASNFYNAPLTYKGLHYATSEHFYQAHKTSCPKEREIIRKSPTAGKAKRLGSGCTLRKDWEEVKLDIMRLATHLKYSQNEDVREMLVYCDPNLLVEWNTWGDHFWGKCPDTNVGQNWLGKILLEERNAILNKEK